MARKKAGRGGGKPRDPNPADALRDFEATVERGLPTVAILRGEERYFRDQGVRVMVEAAKAAGLEICRHDGHDPEYDAARLLDDLSTGALFGGARCVVVHGAERIVVDRATHASPAIRDAMRARIEAGGEASGEGCLVLSAEKLRADHALAKAAKAAGGPIVGCRRLYDTPPPWNPDPRNAELVQWCAARARALGVRIDVGEAAFVVAATGNDLAAIEDQLQRLVGRGDDAVRELVPWTAGASTWDVADHIARGDLERASLGIESLFAGGASQRDGSRVIDRPGIVAQLITAIGAKLREAERGAAELRAGRGAAQAAAAAGVKGPKPAVLAFEKRLAARPPTAWTPMLEDFGALERRSRSGVSVDATDFLAFALRWRLRAPASGRPGGAPGDGSRPARTTMRR
ncbi:MAG: hypothetical protein AAF957_06980 [Planctomycetota bacterium]